MFRKLSFIGIVACVLALILGLTLAAPAVQATGLPVLVDNLQPSWTAPGGGGVFSTYVGPPDYDFVSPGSTAVYSGREVGIIKAGLAVDPVSGNYEDEGLFGFIPNVTIDSFAAGTLTYDVANEQGTNPVWMTIEIDTGVVGNRSDNTTYQFVPTSNPAGWHTVNAAAGQWQLMDNNGNGTGPLMTLTQVATANTGLNVVRAYLRLGMGNSYHGTGAGTVAWVDAATIGGVTYDFVVPTRWYVTTSGADTNEGTLASPFATIQHAIGAASSGDTIHVAAGTYSENVVVSQSVTIAGAGVGNTIVVPAVSNPNPCTNSSLCGGAASNVFLVQASNVVIHDLTVDGDNPALTSIYNRGGANLDARNGIIKNTNAIYNSLEIYNTLVKNIYLRGIYSTDGSFNFHNNTVQNVLGDSNSIGIFAWGGPGTISSNTVSYANDAISANHSNGIQFLNNTVTYSGSGVHTDNSGDGGGVADLIQDNNVDCTGMPNGYGEWVFVPYIAPTVNHNTATNCAVGLSAWGQGAAVTTAFTNNTVHGPAAATGSVGVYVTTDLISWGFTDVAVSFTGNIITGNETGIYLTADNQAWNPGPYVAKTITASFSGNQILCNTSGFDKGTTGTYNANAANNWWGSASGPSGAGSGAGDSIVAGVNFTPWTTSGPLECGSSNPTLTALTVSSGTLNPAFAAGTTSYTANVAYVVSAINVNATVEDPLATIKINGVPTASGANRVVTLNPGLNTINVVVTAKNGTTTKTYSVAMTRAAASTIKTLSNLEFSSGSLNTPFDSGTLTGYVLTLAPSVSAINVKPTGADPLEAIQVNGVPTASGANRVVVIPVGISTITVLVTAQDGSSQSYIITANRPVANADLSALTVSSGTLNPIFAPGTTNYTANVAYVVSAINVNATVVDPLATIKINGVPTASGNNRVVTLNPGLNTINVVVTAKDGTTTKTYSIAMTRAAASTNKSLSNLEVSSGSLAPVFASGTLAYNLVLAPSVSAINVKPTGADPLEAIQVNGVPTASGTNRVVTTPTRPFTINVLVTAQDGTSQTYVVTVISPVINADLSALTVSSGTLNPVFATGTTNYTANVAYVVSAINVNATVVDSLATIKINSVPTASGVNRVVTLNPGLNTINVVVTARDGTTTKTYSIAMTRAAASTIKTLSNLEFSSGSLNTPFDSGTLTGYVLTLAPSVSAINVKPTGADPLEAIKVNGVPTASGANRVVVTPVGTSTITVLVTAQDGTSQSYIVMVNR